MNTLTTVKAFADVRQVLRGYAAAHPPEAEDYYDRGSVAGFRARCGTGRICPTQAETVGGGSGLGASAVHRDGSLPTRRIPGRSGGT